MFPKKIILGVTGSISAYKSAELTRLLLKKQAEVKIILSAGGADFITPLTLATLSKNPVLQSFYNAQTGEWENHVALGLWADLILIAPASANTCANLAHGNCKDLLQAVYLSAKCPVIIAPAMDHDMWHHSATQRNMKLLKEDGCNIIEPHSGELASGLIGDGRLPEPEIIVKEIESHFS